MALVTKPPTNNVITAAPATVTPGLAVDLRGKLNAAVAAIDNKARAIMAHVEALVDQIGPGVVAGGAVTPGVGLAVHIDPLTALCGNPVTLSGTSVVNVPGPGLHHLWLRQDGSFTTNHGGQAPGHDDGHGAAVYWGNVTADPHGIKAVSNIRDTADVSLASPERQRGRAGNGHPRGALGPASVDVSPGTVTLAPAQALAPVLVFFGQAKGTAGGTALVRLPQHYPGQGFQLDNRSAGPVRFAGPDGGSVVVGASRAALFYGDGVDIRRLTADVEQAR